VSDFLLARYFSRCSMGTRDQSLSRLMTGFQKWLPCLWKYLIPTFDMLVVSIFVGSARRWRTIPFRNNQDGTCPCWFGDDAGHQRDHVHRDAFGCANVRRCFSWGYRGEDYCLPTPVIFVSARQTNTGMGFTYVHDRQKHDLGACASWRDG
jgi:hypothetical protein